MIHRTIVALSAVAACTLTFTASANEGWVSIGRANGEGAGTSLSVAGFGASGFGMGLGVVFNSEFADKSVLDYPVPHTNYSNLGVKRTANTLGLDGYYAFNAGGSVRPYVGLGIYSGERKTIAQSNVTGWYYNQGNKNSTQGAAEVGLMGATDSGWLFGIGYHSVRGGNLSIGKRF